MRLKITRTQLEESVKNLSVRQEQLLQRKAVLNNDIQEMQKELEGLVPQIAANGAMLQTYQAFLNDSEDELVEELSSEEARVPETDTVN